MASAVRDGRVVGGVQAQAQTQKKTPSTRLLASLQSPRDSHPSARPPGAVWTPPSAPTTRRLPPFRPCAAARGHPNQLAAAGRRPLPVRQRRLCHDEWGRRAMSRSPHATPSPRHQLITRAVPRLTCSAPLLHNVSRAFRPPMLPHTRERATTCSRARCSFTAPPLPWRTGIDARSTDRDGGEALLGVLLGRGKQSRSRRRRPYLLGSGGTAVQSGPLWLDEEGRVWLKRAALVCQRWGLGWSKWPALDTPPAKRAALDT